MKLMKRRMDNRAEVGMVQIAHISIPLNPFNPRNSFNFINSSFIDLKTILQNNC